MSSLQIYSLFSKKRSLLLEIIIVYYHIADLGRHHGLIPPD